MAANVDFINHSSVNYKMTDTVDLDILLPNGILLTLNFSNLTTLEQVKNKIWQDLKLKYPTMIDQFKKTENYTFVSVTQEAKTIEYYDYSKRLCDLKLFFTFFKLIESHGNLAEKAYNSDLSKTIGLYVNEIELIKDIELVEFRLKLLEFIKERQNEKLNTPNKFEAMMNCLYSPNLEIDPSLLDVSIMSAVNSLNQFTFSNLFNKNEKNSNKIEISVHVMETDMPEIVYNLNVPLSYTPTDITIEVIKKKLSGLGQTKDQMNDVIERYKDAYMLNVCGCDEIFYGSAHKLSSYKYIRKCLSNCKRPNFHLISTDNVKSKSLKLDEQNLNLINKYIKEQESQIETYNLGLELDKKSIELSWNISEQFSIYLDSLLYLPYLKDCSKLFLKIAIYHGQELVTRRIESEKFELEKLGKDSSLKLNQPFKLDVRIKDLHRCAKLCISLYCVSKKKREFFSIGWISLNLFDYNGYLIEGKKKLFLWQTTQNSFLNLCLSDVTGQNPNKDYIRLNVEFLKNKPVNQLIVYPNKEKVIRFIKHQTSENSQDDCFDVSYALENDNVLLESILSKDALAELTEQEKNVLWRRREDCINYPHSLPKLLQTVKWSNHLDVIETYNLLFRWPDIKPIVAIELLHSIHSDIEVRNFAVKCLDKHMKDEEVQQYLLQLVQTLKNEPYYDNSLTRFLLRRAFKSQRIGFDLFWNLKSEMKNPRYKYRFGLILEAYCRGISSSELKDLLKQVEVVEKLTILSTEIKNNPDNISLVKSSFLHDTLKSQNYNQSVSNFISPLNRSHILGSIDPTSCRILTSAKRPLYLSWFNNIEYASYYEKQFELIFKHGDDLRQDMLTLQIIKLMDIIWKNEGLDLKLIVYDCFTTGSKTGFIEVIKNSMTLFKIQMEGGIKGRYQIDTSQLFKWISSNNANEKLDEAIDSFTKSCAGFCVATFILGIGDRHPDNIMVNRDGKLFHIDFGHFLGHFKKKYGIKRERVPFVLTEDFTKVITRCSSNHPLETDEFKLFQKLCENAYMIIRRYSHLIINLFALMLSSDMPELQSIEDIMYLRKTLAIDETDEKALEYFRSQFIESYKLSYTTKLDWMCHALNKKNRI